MTTVPSDQPCIHPNYATITVAGDTAEHRQCLGCTTVWAVPPATADAILRDAAAEFRARLQLPADAQIDVEIPPGWGIDPGSVPAHLTIRTRRPAVFDRCPTCRGSIRAHLIDASALADLVDCADLWHDLHLPKASAAPTAVDTEQ